MASKIASRGALLALLLGACTSDPVGVDVQIFDAGNPADYDAGPGNDAAADLDADLDAGPSDVDPLDMGAAVDSGPDAGVADAAPDAGEDGGLADAGVDAGGDAGVPVDAGDDAGAVDTGVDAGAVDAGGPGPVPSGYAVNQIDSTFREAEGLSVIDLDADGDQDVIAAISLTQTIRLYVNGGNSSGGGTGTVWSTVPVAPPGSTPAMGTSPVDVDGDGDLDIAAVGLYSPGIGFGSPGDVAWYRNPGNVSGTWLAQPVSIGQLYGLRAIASGDLTGDGRPDLVAGCSEVYDGGGSDVGCGLYWFANINGTAFGAPTPIAALIGVEVVEIVDVDRNGVPDVVASVRGNDMVAWYENLRTPGQVDANPTFVEHVIASIMLPNGIALGQLDPDAALELVVIHDDGAGGALMAFDQQTDPRDPWVPVTIDGAFGGAPPGQMRVEIVDLNRDGLNDVAVASSIHNQIRAYIRRTGFTWQMQSVATNLVGVGYIESGDLSGDGYPDLVTSTNATDPSFDRIQWWRTQP